MTTKHPLSASLQTEYNINSQRWVPPVFPNFTLYNGPAINWVASPVKYGLVKTLLSIGVFYILYFAMLDKKIEKISKVEIAILGVVTLVVYFFCWLSQYKYNNTYLDLATSVSDNLMYSDIVGGTTNFGRRRLL